MVEKDKFCRVLPTNKAPRVFSVIFTVQKHGQAHIDERKSIAEGHICRYIATDDPFGRGSQCGKAFQTQEHGCGQEEILLKSREQDIGGSFLTNRLRLSNKYHDQ